MGSLEQRRHLGVGQIVAFEDDAAQAGAAFQHIDGVFGFPSALSDQNKIRSRFAKLVDQLAPEIEQQQVVLARLDCADADEIWWL